MKPILLIAAALLLAACGQGQPPAAAVSVKKPAVSLAPELQRIYDQSCRNCHGYAASGAPRTGDVEAWAPRIAQGRETLLDHTLGGYKGMPPMGGCTQCGEADFIALIEYMSGAQLK